MKPNLLNLLADTVKAYGVRMSCYGEDLSGLEACDDGLRSRLFLRNDTRLLAEFFRSSESGALYIMDDPYGCRYGFFRPPEDYGAETRYCLIGPWLETRPEETAVNAMLKKRKIPLALKNELAAYLERAPHISSPRSWEAALLIFTGYLYGGRDTIPLFYHAFDQDRDAKNYSPEPQESLSLREIEERYKNENAMLEAVSEGDAKRAVFCLSGFRGKIQVRTADKLRNTKNYLIILNSLCRKAAENGYVHPAHLDAVSGGFARQIENAPTLAYLTGQSEIMLHRYCALVQEFSLRKYSPLIRNVINAVDFNLRENLSLKILAKQCNVDPSYLSAQFKREKNMTVTDYIHTQRLRRAASLLRNSGCYIQDVAEQCGFLDVNYFCRLFKRQYGRPLREFRAALGLSR
ncbi:MAG: helix-turn-helix transcriptional regulator [Treponema sp.]|nr:helix-turn-helix transcriptional regulator [Treponema sp.]